MIEDCKVGDAQGLLQRTCDDARLQKEVVDKRRGRYKRKECKYPECTNMEYGTQGLVWSTAVAKEMQRCGGLHSCGHL